MSLHDPLTGLANRRLLFSEPEHMFAAASRHSRPLSVIMMDLDYFKDYNDAHGQAAGSATEEEKTGLSRNTLSLGISSLAPGIPGGDALIGLADRALYEAKRKGRNRVLRSITSTMPPLFPEADEAACPQRPGSGGDIIRCA